VIGVHVLEASRRRDAAAEPPPLPVVEWVLLGAVAVGCFVLDLNLRSAGAPTALPLATLTWAVVGAVWVVPALRGLLGPAVRRTRDGVPLVWFAAWFAVGAASAPWSVHPARTLTVVLVSAIPFLGAWTVVTEFGWERFARAASVGLAAFLSLGLFRDLVQLGHGTELGQVLTGEVRMAGLSYSPTDLGRTAAFAAVLGVVAAFATAGWERLFHLGAVSVAVAAQVSTNTRIITGAMVLMAVVALSRRRPRLRIGLLAASAVVVCLAALDPGRVVDVVAREGEPDQHVIEVGGRSPVWGVAIDIWSESPVIGHGWASNEMLFAEAWIRDELPFDAVTAHNAVLGVLVETGVLGLSVLIAAVVATWRRLHGRWVPALVLGLVVVTGITEATLVRPGLVFAVLGAIAAVATKERAGTSPPTVRASGASDGAR
jgi:O-antigen ligase